MTPAVTTLKQASVPYQLHEYAHVAGTTDFGLEAVRGLGQDPDRIFKTLVVELTPMEMAVACIPVVTTLNLKRLAKACGAKKAALARPSKIPTVTGYILGAVSPIGQKLPLRTIVDASAALHSTIFVSGGRRGLEIEITYDALLGLSAGRLAKLSV